MGEAKRRRDHDQLVALAAYAVVAFDEPAEGQQRVAPTEFRLFHAGVNHTAKGDFLFDDVAAESVMAAYAARNHSVPMMGDYEHQSLATPPMKALASATQFVPEVRRGSGGGPELWATQVQWTDDAKRELEAGQYRLYSPAFVPDKDGRIASLINFALTNLPASYEIAPLVAASANTPTGEPAMDEKELKALKDQVAELGARCEKMNALCLKRLGKSFDDWSKEEDAEHEEAKAKLTALSSFQGKVMELAGKTDPAEALGAVALAVTQGQEFVALKQKMVADAAKALETEFSAMVDAAVAQGKLAPAGPVSKEFFVSLKAEFGTEKALVALKKAVPANAEPIIQLTAPREPNPSSAVSGTQIEIASNCGGRFGGVNQFKALREAEEKRAGNPAA
jgi:phage I-like protein